MQDGDQSASESRRGFLTAASAAAASGFWAPDVHAAGLETIRVGLVGCGGRGSGAAGKAMLADPNVRLVALADLFPERLEASKAPLKTAGGDQYAVTDDNCHSGFDGYKKVVDACDVVLLATPPHFRPAMLRYAVEKGKHVFFEKPVAVDAPGVRSVLETAKMAREKNLSLRSGFCYRTHDGVRELMKRVHAGAIGDIIAIQSTYNAGYLWNVERTEKMSDMEWQLRNWMYFTWLSGDHNVEQHVHSIDKAMWVMESNAARGLKTHPLRCVGLGGRQSRVEPKWGNIFDHHSVVYEFDGGVRCYSFCRQQADTKSEDSDIIMGSKGKAICRQFKTQRIEIGAYEAWSFDRNVDPYLQEHKDHFESIRAGKPLATLESAAHSTLMAIMGRMATYTGQEITWEMAMSSKQDLSPKKYEFGPLPTPEVAKPGQTKFI